MSGKGCGTFGHTRLATFSGRFSVTEYRNRNAATCIFTVAGDAFFSSVRCSRNSRISGSPRRTGERPKWSMKCPAQRRYSVCVLCE
jgi:hypothetical protein